MLSITAALTTDDETKHSHFTVIDFQAAAQAVELGVDLEQLKTAAHEILEQELSSDIESYFTKLIADAIKAEGDGSRATHAIAAIDSALAGDDETALNSLNNVLNARMEGRAGKLATSVCSWILDLVDAPDGVDGAKHAAE